ncbi:MAG: dihydrolipoamide succinyltransferase, partial [Hyphomicrobiaceae bacterium]|nr:dihydrolipoamide succinyltransferase [Hyphomicrobiaceae bacterium]
MAIEIKVPTLGESVTEATIGKWFKKAGDAIKVDEPLCELETDKVTVEVPAPSAGVLAEIIAEAGTTVAVGSVLGLIKEGAGGQAATTATAVPKTVAPAVAVAAARVATPAIAPSSMPPSPSARRVLDEKGLSAADVQGSG